MVNEQKLKEAFGKAKEDVEGVKNELAFALKRIAKIEEILNKRVIEEIAKGYNKSSKKKR
jgi:hypothetical protein